MFPKKFLVFTILILIAGVALFGCTESEPTPTPTPEPAVIGLALSDLSNPFFVSVQDGAQEAADRLGATLIVRDAQNDAERQNEQIQELIDEDVSALLINPVNGEAVVPAIEAANDADIPVFTVDRSAEGGEIVSHIASDNVAGGQMAGNYLAETIRESGNVVELEGIPETSAAQDRGAGFTQAVGTYQDISIVASEVANFSREEGKETFATILEEHEDIDAVFAHNDEMILGAIAAAQEAGRADEMVFVGFDAVDDAIAAVESGDLNATIAQQPTEMGRLGVEMAVQYLNGESVPDTVPVDLALVAQ